MSLTIDSSAPCTIVIVDDNQMDRMLLKEAICIYSSRFKILEFGGGDPFLTWVSSTKRKDPFLILMDLNMPGQNGLETIKEFKRHYPLSKASIVVVSASQEESEWTAAKELGVEELVYKSSDFNLFTTEIQNVLMKYNGSLDLGQNG